MSIAGRRLLTFCPLLAAVIIERTGLHVSAKVASGSLTLLARRASAEPTPGWDFIRW